MKILTGKFKGKNIYMPQEARPTQNVLRKAIFDILGHDLEGLSFLELFAGSGAVGLEAISNGAGRVIMVERNPKNTKVLKRNMDILEVSKEKGDYRLVESDVFAFIKLMAKQGMKFDIVFFDPPYREGLAKKTLNHLFTYDILQPRCLIAAQYDKWDPLPEVEAPFSIIKHRKYGSSFFDLIER